MSGKYTKATLLFCLLASVTHTLLADRYDIHKNLSYLEPEALAQADDYRKEKAQMDLYLPKDKQGFATVIWLHGGGLTGGRRSLPELESDDIAVISASYRLSPQAEYPAYIEDAAAVTAWALRHIAEYGGDPQKVFIGGHSAGGYLAAMVGMDPRWLEPYGISNKQLAGLLLMSAQVTTHFHVKKSMGDTGHELRPLIDERAPLYHAAADLPPILLLLGDRKIEWKSRVEENVLLHITLLNLGHPLAEFYEFPGRNHGTVRFDSWPIIPGFIDRALALRQQQAAGQAQPAQ